MTAPFPREEFQRLQSLRSYQIVNSEQDESYDDLTELAANICSAPISLITMVEEERQWFKSRFNCEVRESPRDLSFCAYAILSEELCIVPDLLEDPRFFDSPFVTGQPHVRFYAGAPLVAPDGMILGTICVLDTEPRKLSGTQEEALQVLSRIVMTKLELRRKNRILAETSQKNEAQELLLADLRASEQQSRLLGDAFSPIHWSMNANLTDFQGSDRWLEFTGLTEETLAERGWVQTIHPDDQSWALAEIEKAHALGEAHGAEVRLLHNDGSWRWMHVQSIPLKNANGDIARWLGTNVDIHERHEAVEALQRSEERLRLALDADSLGTWDANLATNLVYWDRRGQELFGTKENEATLSDALASVHPDDRESATAEILAAISRGDGLYQTEFRVVWPDQSVHWLESHGRVQFSGEEGERSPVRITSVVRDITESRKVGQALQTKTELLTAVSESLEVFLTQGDWNKALARLLRCALEQTASDYGFTGVLTDDRKELRVLTYEGVPDDADVPSGFTERVKQSFRDTGFLGFNQFEDAFGGIIASGEVVISNTPIADPVFGSVLPPGHPPLNTYLGVPIRRGAEVVGMIALANRVDGYAGTEQTALEMLVQQAGVLCDSYRQNEREAVLKREHELLESQLRQSQKMEAIGQLAGGVAHDFNNLLTVITGHAELSLMQFPISGQQRDSLLQIAMAGERAAQLTRQLLTFSRRQLFQPNPIDLNAVIEEIVKMLRRMVGENMDILTDLSPDLCCILADAGMIEQVLMNFVVNARDAMPGGGEILIKTGERVIDEAYCESKMDAKPGRCVSIGVSDTGCGISPEHLARIFEPFYTTKEIGAGTGLGLATVYGIVQQHGGWIEVESKPGVGTTFTVLIPATNSVMADDRVSIHHTVRGGVETILLVEDEEFVRALARQVLEEQGYAVLEAANGAEALEMWEANRDKVALLLTDMVMPGKLSGRDVAETLLLTRPELPVIYTSGYSQELLNTGLSLRDGITFLPKPYRPVELIQVIREALDRRE